MKKILKMTDDKDYLNLAATLRDICANSDKTTGKILNKADKAAKAGLDHIKVRCSVEEYNYIYKINNGFATPNIIPPLIEKLFSLGFRLSCDYEMGFFVHKKYYLILWW